MRPLSSSIYTMDGSLGQQPFCLSIGLSKLPTSFQLLERARGVLWSQMLQLRDPLLERVPEELAFQLRSLLRATTPGLRETQDETLFASLTPNDRNGKYTQRNQLQDAIRQIRFCPGLSDFMRGTAAEAPMSAAARSFVVVLVAGTSEFHAFVIQRASNSLTLVPLPGITEQSLKATTYEAFTSRKRGSSFEPECDERLMAGAKDWVLQPYARLSDVWHGIIKPVLTQLGLSVRRMLGHGCVYS